MLEGGSGFFGHVDPAGTSIDLPAASPGRGPKTGGTGALLRPRPGSRPAGRRRGRSGDRRLWFALAGVVVVFAGALAAIFTLAFPSGPGGPDHSLVTPDKLNAFIRRPALEQQMNVGQLRQDVVDMSAGQARHVVEAVYEAGDSTSGTTPQIVLFIGGNLLNASPKVSVTSFTQRFKGAGITSAGSLGGEAACVNATASEPGSVAMCAWFDNDSFGEVVSPTMNASALANTMRQIRPHVELVVRAEAVSPGRPARAEPAVRQGQEPGRRSVSWPAGGLSAARLAGGAYLPHRDPGHRDSHTEQQDDQPDDLCPEFGTAQRERDRRGVGGRISLGGRAARRRAGYGGGADLREQA